MIKQKTAGLIAAPFTPLRADRTLNLNAVDQYARWLHTNGVVGADTSVELWIYDPTLQYNVRIVGSEQDLNPRPTGFDGLFDTL